MQFAKMYIWFHTFTVAILLGNSFARMAKLAVQTPANPAAMTERVSRHITM